MEILGKEYRKIHKWLRDNFGYAYKCEHPKCNKKSKYFSWALLKGKKYKYKRKNYFMLCKSCHTKYDYTAKGRLRGIAKTKGRKNTIKTRKLMSKIAVQQNRRPPAMTKKQIKIQRKRMIGNTYGFKKGFTPWNKGKRYRRKKV